MPIFLFAFSQVSTHNWHTSVLAFVILHLFIFPASNGYNSYQDKDETSIGGLKYPPKVSKKLFYATLLMDIIGLLCSLFVSGYFFLFVLIAIVVSRIYSYRKVRLKKYAIIGFITVFIFQGAFTFMMSFSAITGFSFNTFFSIRTIICMIVSSLFIGSFYPLSQIYQHEADKLDGVISISYKLGYKGTFFFSSILFIIGSIIFFYYFNLKHQNIVSIIFILINLPSILKLIIWFVQVIKDNKNANFENAYSMSLVTSSCMNLFFIILILNNFYNWF